MACGRQFQTLGSHWELSCSPSKGHMNSHPSPGVCRAPGAPAPGRDRASGTSRDSAPSVLLSPFAAWKTQASDRKRQRPKPRGIARAQERRFCYLASDDNREHTLLTRSFRLALLLCDPFRQIYGATNFQTVIQLS